MVILGIFQDKFISWRWSHSGNKILNPFPQLWANPGQRSALFILGTIQTTPSHVLAIYPCILYSHMIRTLGGFLDTQRLSGSNMAILGVFRALWWRRMGAPKHNVLLIFGCGMHSATFSPNFIKIKSEEKLWRPPEISLIRAKKECFRGNQSLF